MQSKIMRAKWGSCTAGTFGPVRKSLGCGKWLLLVSLEMKSRLHLRPSQKGRCNVPCEIMES
jgi:hypothetical protein